MAGCIESGFFTERSYKTNFGGWQKKDDAPVQHLTALAKISSRATEEKRRGRVKAVSSSVSWTASFFCPLQLYCICGVGCDAVVVVGAAAAVERIVVIKWA